MAITSVQNKILAGLMTEFQQDFELVLEDDAKLFEKLVNYVLLSKIDPEAFEDPATFDLIDVDKKSTFGIDSFALFINDNLVTAPEQVENHRRTKRLDVRFVFVQAKRSTSVDTGDVLKFTAAVRNFFCEVPSIPLSDELKDAKLLVDEVFKHENARLFANSRPRCELFFATTGTVAKDDKVVGVVKSEERLIHACVPEMRSVSLTHIDADFVIDSYNEIENRDGVLITFDKSIPCEKIGDVEQAFIGYLSGAEFLKLITCSDGSVRKNIFYENVRDFQGVANSVNREINDTLTDEALLDKFILLNNGVTVVARDFRNIRATEYEISNYYIVNGCQTSNILFSNKILVSQSAKLKIPVKIIHTTSNDLIAKLIRSTNRQTPVPDEAFVSLERFHKRLQDFYKITSASNDSPAQIYYERRSKEFTGDETRIDKAKIVNLHALIRSFTAIILNEPQLAMSQNPSAILREHRSKMFLDDHKYLPYFISSLVLYIFHRLVDRGEIDRRHVIARYWVCWIARILFTDSIEMGYLNSNKADKEAEKMLTQLNDVPHSIKVFQRAVNILQQSKDQHAKQYGSARTGELIRLRSFRDVVRHQLNNTRI